MANFTTDDYFLETPPDKWQLARFSDYCYQLPGFPGKGQRKRLAQKLWVTQLQKRSEDSGHARKLLQDPRDQSRKRNQSRTKNEGRDLASTCPRPRPDAHNSKRNRRETLEVKPLSPLAQFKSRVPLKPQVQPVRQRLLSLKDTLITQSHSTSTKNIEKTLSHLYEVRSTIDRLIEDLERTRKSFPKLCSEVHECLDGIANDPLLTNDDYLLTEKDDTSDAETVVI
ncbi:hypothetical protein EV426DRAFT_717895 [Tirmania nivea]|nr:hypothetical protein EV426DRAFT_717895 [Tirmania nivea]